MPRGPSDAPCATCGRERPLSFHHLIPRSEHRRGWCKRRFSSDEMQAGIDVCTDCHQAFHRFATERQLGEHHHTLQTLLEHPEIGRFVRWVAGQSGRFRTARRRDRQNR